MANADAQGAGDKTTAAASRNWQQLVVVAVLVSVYALIPSVAFLVIVQEVLASGAGAGGPTIDESLLFDFLQPLSSPDGSLLEVLHKIILPLAALFVGASFGEFTRRRLASWLFVVPLVGVLLSLGAASLIDAFHSATFPTKYPGVPGLFRDMAANLGVFMALMIGVSMHREDQT
jgi:hypothetical protein